MSKNEKISRIGGAGLTTKELELLASAYLAAGEPKPDYDLVANYTGYTVGSSSVMLGQARRKAKAALDPNGTSPAPKIKTPATGKSSAKKRGTDGTEDTPTKRSRKGKKTAFEEEKEVDDAVDDKDIKDEDGIKEETEMDDDDVYRYF